MQSPWLAVVTDWARAYIPNFGFMSSRSGGRCKRGDVSILGDLKVRLRTIVGALLRSEQHLESTARSGETLRSVPQQLERIERHIGFLAADLARRELVKIMAEPRFQDPLRLERSGFRIHSQYDEDGIIAEIFRRIGTTSRTFVEFGSGNGAENCAGALLLQGWRGLWIEGNSEFRANIERMWRAEFDTGHLTLRTEFVTPDNINRIIETAGFSGEIDFLAVDVDGQDYHVLEAISAVSPRVICAEYNCNLGPDLIWTLPRNDAYVWDGVDYRTGVSLKALELLLTKRGYALVGCSVAGVNAFFVRHELAEGKFASPFTSENHFNAFRLLYAGSAQKDIWRGWRV
jgi:hypothetical protein